MNRFLPTIFLLFISILSVAQHSQLLGESPYIEGAVLKRSISRATLESSTSTNLFEDCRAGEYLLGMYLVYTTQDRSMAEDWHYALTFDLLDENGAVLLANQSLRVESIKDSTQTYVAAAYYETPFTCAEARDYSIQFNAPDFAANAPQEIYLEFHLFQVPAQGLVDYPEGVFRFDKEEHTDRRVNLYWEYLLGAREYELEWVFIDAQVPEYASLQAAYAQGDAAKQAEFPFTFKKAVRVSTTHPYYDFEANYPEGTLYYRLRAVGRHPDNPAQPTYGLWHYLGQNDAPLQTNIAEGETITPHEPDLNWQYVTTYAEEGKNKKVMSYYDGSLRNRQTLTNLSTQQQSLVAETLYDHEGRGVVNILPVPINVNNLSYQTNFNQFEGGDQSKNVYDDRTTASPKLSDATGAGKYYSPNNDSDGPLRDYIPDSKGYAYTQVEYLNDNTGRIRSQSGVGETFRLRTDANGNTGKVTQYFYGGANQSELYRLFGSNVGEVSHYKKNMVVDPNGQVSVSYLDQEGRAIATALAGLKPENLEALPSLENLNPEEITVPLNIESSDPQVVNTHLNTVPNTTYGIDYQLTGGSLPQGTILADGTVVNVCDECRYTFTFFITDPDEKRVEMDITPTANGTEKALITTDYYQVEVTGAECVEATLNLAITTTFEELGSYRIVKSLVANQKEVEDLYLEARETLVTQKEQLEQQYISEIDFTQCEPCTDIEDCPEQLEEALNFAKENECNFMLQQIKSQVAAQNGLSVEDLDDEDPLLKDHPEYCHYQACEANQESNDFDRKLSFIKTYSEAKEKFGEFVDAETGETSLIDQDPYFTTGPGANETYISHVLNLLRAIKDADENTLGSIGQVINESTIDPGSPLIQEDAHIFFPAGVDEDQRKWILFQAYYNSAKLRAKEMVLDDWVRLDGGIGCFYLSERDANEIAPYTVEEAIVQDPTLGLSEKPSLEEVQTLADEQMTEFNQLIEEAQASSQKVNVLIDQLVSDCDLEIDMQPIEQLLSEYLTEAANAGYDLESFSGNPLGLILKEDLATNPYLTAIEDILNQNGCSLAPYAQANPFGCQEFETYTTPATVNIPTFCGGGQYLNVQEYDGLELPVDGFSIELWGQIENSDGADVWALIGDNSVRFSLEISENHVRFYSDKGDSGVVGAETISISTTKFNNYKPHHLVLTKNNLGLDVTKSASSSVNYYDFEYILYIDGVEEGRAVDSRFIDKDVSLAELNTQFGGFNIGGSQSLPFCGSIQGVGIWGKMLPSAGSPEPVQYIPRFSEPKER